MSESLLLLIPLALCAGGVALFVFRASPRTTFVAWTLVLFLVPIWIGVTAGIFWAAIILVTIAAIAANLTDLRLAPVDALVALFALLVLVLLALGLASLSHAVTAVLEWIVPYAWGRLALARVGERFIVRTIAAIAAVAAVLAIVEFLSGVNVFTLVPGPGGFAQWSTLQVRGPFLRAEGAFGHSIALGAALAMSTACILAARWRTWVTLLALLAVVGALVVTFSRIGLVTGALTIALSLVALPGLGRAARWSIAAAGAAAVAVILPFLGDVFVDAGDEAAGSAEYRTGQLSLLSEVQVLGSAGDFSGRLADGVYLGAFSESVDNTLLLIALRFGWVAVALVAVALVAIAAGVIRRPNPAAIAVAAQLPALVAVALITQFGVLLWFFAGLAVAWRAMDDDRAREPSLLRRVPPLPRPAVAA
ncbi:hypothetical protein [Agrococcus citreus]|uniref:O-antigen ligase like membrane protein n=1 Tax=Agrococcus citreus TaxID=84643 RepID=A0ABN1YLK4_9MICO